ncbi:hypothetical protein Tco_0083637 [Tanacetum coccineum]
MLVPPVVVGEGSKQPPEPQPTPSTAPPEVGDEAINEEMLDNVDRVATTATSLEAEQASGNINKTQFTTTLNEPFSLELGSGGHTLRSGEDSMEHQIELTNNVPNTPHDSPLPVVNTPGSDEGSLELNELMDLTRRQSLDKKVKDVENQGKIDVDDTKVVKGSGDTEVLDTKKVVNTASEGVSTASVPETVSTAAPTTPPITTIVFDDEDVTMAMAQTLIKMKEEKAKEKGEIESVEKTKKKVQGDAQIERDAEIALRLQAELDEELRVERERQEEASKVAITGMFDEVQARIDADYELAARMTHEE